MNPLVGNDIQSSIKHSLYRTHGHEMKDSLIQTIKRILRGEVSPQSLKTVPGPNLNAGIVEDKSASHIQLWAATNPASSGEGH